jgi:soluble lytic murein transglycosylase-like protein
MTHFARIARRPRVRDLLSALMFATAIATPVAGILASDFPPRDRVEDASPIAAYIDEAGRRFDVPDAWIRAVIRAESGGNVHALSPAGAMGLMQLMPRTWADLRVRYGFGNDPYAPRDNVMAGTAYLRELFVRYGSPGFLAAYNAGPGRYEEHLTNGRALPLETQTYVAKIVPLLGGNQPNSSAVAVAEIRSWDRASLFVASAANSPPADQSSPTMPARQQSARPAIVDLSAIAPQSDGLFVRDIGTRVPQ